MIVVNKKEFVAAVNHVVKSRPIKSNNEKVAIRVIGDTVSICISDMQYGSEISINNYGHLPNQLIEFYIYESSISFLSRWTGRDLGISIVGNTVRFTQEYDGIRIERNMRMSTDGDYAFGKDFTPEAVMSISAKEFKEPMLCVCGAAYTGNSRPTLRCVQFMATADNLRATATDGFSLAFCEPKFELLCGSIVPVQILVEHREIVDFIKAADGDDVKISISWKPGYLGMSWVMLESGKCRTMMMIRVVNAKYPQWESIYYASRDTSTSEYSLKKFYDILRSVCINRGSATQSIYVERISKNNVAIIGGYEIDGIVIKIDDCDFNGMVGKWINPLLIMNFMKPAMKSKSNILFSGDVSDHKPAFMDLQLDTTVHFMVMPMSRPR